VATLRPVRASASFTVKSFSLSFTPHLLVF
jgi:hypothetical protein